MKILLTILAVITSINTYAFTSCSTQKVTSQRLPVFTVNIHHTNKIQALITDRRISNLPKSYICHKSLLTHNGDRLAGYSCFGGGYNEEKSIAIFVNETTMRANYQDAHNENNDLENLRCIIE